MNVIYPEDMKDIEESFGAEALGDCRIDQRRTKKEDLAAVAAQATASMPPASESS